jgi:type VI secretion system protein ImpJ
MATRAVHWHEGMFLRPHHLQAAGRFNTYERARGDKWDLHYNWGLRSLKINREALANNRLVIESLQARLRDGTLVSLPEDAPIPEYDLRGPLERSRDLKVFLAIPSVRLGQPNIGEDGQDGGGRYVVDSQDIEDENTGLHPQPLQVRRLRVRFILSNQEEHAGYEVLPIARIKKSDDANNVPQLDEKTYIPPLLACEAWAPLQVEILRSLYDRIGTKIERLARVIEEGGISIENHAPEDAVVVSGLRALNEGYAVLHILAFADGVHPFEAYLELCRLAGQLAIFYRQPWLQPLDHYDHDDLQRFYKVKAYIDDILTYGFKDPDWRKLPFVGEAQRMQVKLLHEYLDPSWQMFVGVESEIPADRVIKLLTVPGQLDMKVGSADRVDDDFEKGRPGLRFLPAPPPPSLRNVKKTVFLQVDRTARPADWQSVHSSLALAIRLNRHAIEGSIQGQQKLTIRGAGEMCFWLYLVKVPVAAKPASP